MSNNRNLVLGAFFIEGTDKYFFGLRDAKNYQMIKGGNIRGPHGKLIQADPFPNAQKCISNCEYRVTPTGAILDAPMKELPDKCGECDGKWTPKPTEEELAAPVAIKKTEKKSGGFFSFLKRS